MCVCVEDPRLESRIYKKDRKTKEFPRIEGTILENGIIVETRGTGC